ncbi:MAG: hypothetical protein U9R54_10105, partial [Bacteroidota bacterium]|nr:hypothetical protein [Bacteroidota bacterium]
EVGKKREYVEKIKDEKADIFIIDRSLLFYSLIEANNYINKLRLQLSNLEKKKELIFIEHDNRLADNIYKTQDLKTSKANHFYSIFGVIIAMFGFVALFAIALSTFWTYFISYNFDIFNFEQEGSHYWEKMIEKLKAKNPNQPLLGWFVLIGIIIFTIAMFFTFSI